MSGTEDEKMRELRQRVENANPEAAAAAAVRRFERGAIAIPEALKPSDLATPEERRLRTDAGELYRSLIIAGPEGLTIPELHASVFFGLLRCEAAIRFLQRTDEVEAAPGKYGLAEPALRATR